MSLKKSTCHPEKDNASNGLCVNCYYQKKRKENPKKTREQQKKHYKARLAWMKNKSYEYKRNSMLKSHYGITLIEYEKILETQDGCALCGRDNGNKPLNVDHDHNTGKIRGLLCLSCNQALGKFGDNIDGMEKVIEYLRGNYKFSKEV